MDRCPAEISYGSQPRTFTPGEPLAEIPVFRCEREAGHTGDRHETSGVTWVGPPRPAKRLAP